MGAGGAGGKKRTNAATSKAEPIGGESEDKTSGVPNGRLALPCTSALYERGP